VTRKATQQPAEGLSTSEQDIVPTEAGTGPVSLPSPNLKHAVILTAELKNRLHQFQTGMSVLTAEIDGKVTRHEQEVAERKQKHDQEVDELLRQMDDMKKGARMLQAALDASEEAEGE